MTIATKHENYVLNLGSAHVINMFIITMGATCMLQRTLKN